MKYFFNSALAYIFFENIHYRTSIKFYKKCVDEYFLKLFNFLAFITNELIIHESSFKSTVKGKKIRSFARSEVVLHLLDNL